MTTFRDNPALKENCLRVLRKAAQEYPEVRLFLNCAQHSAKAELASWVLVRYQHCYMALTPEQMKLGAESCKYFVADYMVPLDDVKLLNLF